MGGGGSSAPEKQEIRYAPYLEEAHKRILNNDGDVLPSINVFTAFNSAINSSPYGDVAQHDPREAFFGYKDDGTTLWAVYNFPSLYDMFGKFMAGLDVCNLWSQIYEDMVHGPEVNAAVSAHAASLKDNVDTQLMPSFKAGMRDINAVQGSSFIVGKALLYDTVTKESNKFAGNVRLKMIDATNQVWAKHLEWNTTVVNTYSELIKLFYNTQLAVETKNLEYAVKDQLWNLNLFDYARALLGALNGAAATAQGGGNEPSDFQQAAGGALSGAAMGATITGGNPIGAAAGGLIGLAGSLF